MKYICRADDPERTIHYGRYLEYLETVRGLLPPDVHAFAADERYFSLDSPHTLHDSWLDSVEVRESRRKERPFEPVVGITVRLLGSLHDRVIVLDYGRVGRYELRGRAGSHSDVDSRHGDVFTREVRLAESGNILHEILFQSDSIFLIECRDFAHREELL